MKAVWIKLRQCYKSKNHIFIRLTPFFLRYKFVEYFVKHFQIYTMKTLPILFLLSINFAFGQSISLIPNSATNSEVLKLRKIGIGLDHRTTDNFVGVGTYVNGIYGIIQTHTNHPLGLGTNNGAIQAILLQNGNFGLGGITNPQFFLDINGRSRIRHNGNTAGIWFSKTNNYINEGSFYGNINDNQAGIWIGNAWRFGLSDAGVVNIPNLAGTGTRPVGADANGNLVVSNSTATAFSVSSLVGTSVYGSGTESQVILNHELFDTSNNFDNGYYEFVAPTSGIYHFTMNIAWQGNADGIREIILRNGSNIYLASFFSYPPNAQSFLQNFSIDLNLTAGSSVRLFASQTSGTSLNISSIYKTFAVEPMFSGYKVN